MIIPTCGFNENSGHFGCRDVPWQVEYRVSADAGAKALVCRSRQLVFLKTNKIRLAAHEGLCLGKIACVCTRVSVGFGDRVTNGEGVRHPTCSYAFIILPTYF